MRLEITAAVFALIAIHASTAAPLARPPLDAELVAVSNPEYVAVSLPVVKRQGPVQPVSVPIYGQGGSILGKGESEEGFVKRQEPVNPLTVPVEDITFVKRQTAVSPVALSSEQLKAIADILALRITSSDKPVAAAPAAPASGSIGAVAFASDPTFVKRQEPRLPVAVSEEATFVKRQEPVAVADDNPTGKTVF